MLARKKMKKLRITHINTLARAGGASTFMRRLVSTQKAMGHQAYILSGESVRTDNFVQGFSPAPDPKVEQKCIENGWLDYEYQGSHRLVEHELIRASDIVHCNNLHGSYFNPWSISALSHVKPVVWTLHDMQSITGHCAHSFVCERWKTGCGNCPDLKIYPAISMDSTARLLRDKQTIYDHSYLQIAVPADWLRKKVQKSILRNHPVELIYNSCDTEVFRPYEKSEIRRQLRIPEDVFVVGAVAHGGTLANPWKGGSYTKSVWDTVKKQIPGGLFLNIGAAQPSDDPSILNVKPVQDEKVLARLYNALDVFLYTPVADTCPLVVIETLSCGVPIVTYDTGGIPELVRHGVDGFVFRQGEINSLIQAVRGLCENRERVRSMGQKARQEAEARFSLECTARGYLDLYHRCLENHRRRIPNIKYFDFRHVPEVIKTPAFIRSEKVKGQCIRDYDPALQPRPELSILERPETFTCSRKSHFALFEKYGPELYGRKIDPQTCDLKEYQDLLIFTFIKNHVPKGSRILDVGGGNSRILNHFYREYECWNVDPLEGLGSGLRSLDPKGRYRLVRDSMGSFNRELPDHYFDLVFSISALEHVPEADPVYFEKIREDINRVLKPGGCSLHCFDVILKKHSFWTNSLLPFLFNTQPTLNRWVSPDSLRSDPDLYVMTESAYNQGWRKITGRSYEQFGKPLSYNVLWQKQPNPPPRTKEPEADYSDNRKESSKNRPRIPVHKNESVTLGTSLAPKQIETQQRAVQSWLDAGFEVVSVNHPDEIQALQPHFRQVQFVPVTRNGSELYGKPLIYVDDVLESLKRSKSEIVGIINSDIHLRMDTPLRQRIVKEAGGAVAYARRVNCTSLQDGDGELEKWGIDLFFMDRRILDQIPTSPFCLGAAWWDTFLPMMCVIHDIPLKCLDERFAFHVRHPLHWNYEQWFHTGIVFYDLLCQVSQQKLPSHPYSDRERQWLGFRDFHKSIQQKGMIQNSHESCYACAKQIHDLVVSHTQMVRKTVLPVSGCGDTGRAQQNSSLICPEIAPCLDITLATSLAPGNTENQLRAVRSWLRNGFQIISLNCPEEIELLQSAFPEVTFRSVRRDARTLHKKPLVFLDDMLSELGQFPSRIVGLINSDIVLDVNPQLCKRLAEEAIQSVILLNRINLKSLSNREGQLFEKGFDFFLMDRNLLKQFPSSEFCLGAAWWDYYVPLVSVLKGWTVKRVSLPFVYHVKHALNWDLRSWISLGHYFYKHLSNLYNRGEFGHLPDSFISCLNRSGCYFETMIQMDSVSQAEEDLAYQYTNILLDIIYNCSKEIEQPDIFPTQFLTEQPSTKSKPLVSALVSTYNSEEFIRGCLQDLVEQTLYQKGQLEIIVINSGSQQNERTVVEEFQRTYRHIRYIETERETIYGAWNRGIRIASGKYITNANTDDRHSPEMLEKLALTLEQNPDAAYVYSHFYITEVPNQTWQTKTPCFTADWHPEYSRVELLQRYYCGPQPMWRKSLHAEYGYFDEQMKVSGDYEFALRISQTHKLMRVREVLGLYLRNPSSLERTAGTREQEDTWIMQFYITAKGYVRRPYIPVSEGGDPRESFVLKRAAGPIITMVTLGKCGRFGNQIFQYAFLKIYAKRHNLEVHTPVWIGQALFGHQDPLITRSLPLVRERSHDPDKSIVLNHPDRFENVNFWGYFQYHTSYYAPDKHYFRSLFKPVGPLQQMMERAMARIHRRGKTLVGIHLRRGDYGFKCYFIAPTQWYKEWLRQIWDSLDDPVLYIASDEPDKVLGDFAEYNPITSRDLDADLPGVSCYPDFYVLSQCDRVAISNSSFSFAACMLNERATEFMRPRLSERQLHSFDPWNSVPVYEDETVEAFGIGGKEQTEKDLIRPRFSLIMRNYNKGLFIQEAIESVLAQTIQDWQLIIVDDASTDNSVEVIQPYLRDSRIELIQHETNCGASQAALTGIAAVRAEIFGELDSDDALAPEALERMIQAHLKHPECGFIYSQHTICDIKLKPVKSGFCRPIPAGQTTIEAAGRISAFRTYKLRDYKKTAMHDIELISAEDKDMYHKMEEVAGIHYVPDSLYFIREHPQSLGRGGFQPVVGWLCWGRAKINAYIRRSRNEANMQNRDPEKIFEEHLKNVLNLDAHIQFLFQISVKHRDILARELPIPSDLSFAAEDQVVLWIAIHASMRKMLQILKNHGILQSLCRKNQRKTPALCEEKSQTTVVSHSLKPADSPPPYVSVYMAAYNAQSYIRKAIESVLDQTFKDFELIIVDDGSTDGTEEAIRSFSDPRIRFVRQAHQNFAAAMNHAIRLSRGEFILGVDSDDYIESDYIQRLLEYARTYPEYDYYYPAGLTLFGEQVQQPNAQWNYKDFKDSRLLLSVLFLNGASPIPNPGSLKRRSLYKQCGLYRELDTVEDFDFLARNALNIRFKRVNGLVGYHYRVHSGSNRNRMILRNRITADVLEEMIHKFPATALCPALHSIEDPQERERKFGLYVSGVFERLAQKYQNQSGSVFADFAQKYKQTSSEPISSLSNLPLTVYMVAYNAESTVERAIRSVLDQTWDQYELIFVDDGSTDQTVQIVQSFKDSRIRLVQQEHKNFAAGMNQAIQLARGEFVIGIDADDFIDSDYLEWMMRFARQNPDHDYYYPEKLTLVDPQGDLTGEVWEYETFEDSRLLLAILFANGFSLIPNSSALKRKSMFERTGLYRELENVEDFDFLSRNVLQIRFKKVIGSSNYYYRYLPKGNTSRFVQRNQITAECLDRMVQIYPDSLLCPGFSAISEPGMREQKVLDYIVGVFDRLARTYKDRSGQVFEQYAQKYRQKKSALSGSLVKGDHIVKGSLETQLSLAQVHLEQGDLEKAASIYRQILSNNNLPVSAELRGTVKKILQKLDSGGTEGSKIEKKTFQESCNL